MGVQYASCEAFSFVSLRHFSVPLLAEYRTPCPAWWLCSKSGDMHHFYSYITLCGNHELAIAVAMSVCCDACSVLLPLILHLVLGRWKPIEAGYESFRPCMERRMTAQPFS